MLKTYVCIIIPHIYIYIRDDNLQQTNKQTQFHPSLSPCDLWRLLRLHEEEKEEKKLPGFGGVFHVAKWERFG